MQRIARKRPAAGGLALMQIAVSLSSCHAREGAGSLDRQLRSLLAEAGITPLEFGRARGTHYPGDMFAFRAPPLRNVELTGPWLHKGACAALDGVLHLMLDPRASLVSCDAIQLPPDLQSTVHDEPATLDQVQASLDTRTATPIELSETEFSDLMAFVQALTDPAALDPSASIPASVSSGLSVEDQAGLEVR